MYIVKASRIKLVEAEELRCGADGKKLQIIRFYFIKNYMSGGYTPNL